MCFGDASFRGRPFFVPRFQPPRPIYAPYAARFGDECQYVPSYAARFGDSYTYPAYFLGLGRGLDFLLPSFLSSRKEKKVGAWGQSPRFSDPKINIPKK